MQENYVSTSPCSRAAPKYYNITNVLTKNFFEMINSSLVHKYWYRWCEWPRSSNKESPNLHSLSSFWFYNGILSGRMFRVPKLNPRSWMSMRAMKIVAHFPCQLWTLKSITEQLARKTWIFHMLHLQLHFQKWMIERSILFNPWKLQLTGQTHTHTHTHQYRYRYIPIAALFSVYSVQDWSPHMSFILKGSQISALQLKCWFKSKTPIQEYRNEIQDSY